MKKKSWNLLKNLMLLGGTAVGAAKLSELIGDCLIGLCSIWF
jgi:hypothetical protein